MLPPVAWRADRRFHHSWEGCYRSYSGLPDGTRKRSASEDRSELGRKECSDPPCGENRSHLRRPTRTFGGHQLRNHERRSQYCPRSSKDFLGPEGAQHLRRDDQEFQASSAGIAEYLKGQGSLQSCSWPRENGC